MIHRDRLLTDGQMMAKKKEDFNTLSRALSEFNRDLVVTALKVLNSDEVDRSEKLLGQAEFLLNFHTSRDEAQGTDRKKNVLWKFIAKAPDGFCHPRTSMIGTLLEDIEAGLSFEQVSRRFADKMHPLRYRRPQAAPTAGAIKAAEELVEKLGIAPSLERRFARHDEVKMFWTPNAMPEQKKESGSVFGHLEAKGKP